MAYQVLSTVNYDFISIYFVLKVDNGIDLGAKKLKRMPSWALKIL